VYMLENWGQTPFSPATLITQHRPYEPGGEKRVPALVFSRRSQPVVEGLGLPASLRCRISATSPESSRGACRTPATPFLAKAFPCPAPHTLPELLPHF